MFNDTVHRKVYKLATSALFNFELFFCCFRFCLRSAVYTHWLGVKPVGDILTLFIHFLILLSAIKWLSELSTQLWIQLFNWWLFSLLDSLNVELLSFCYLGDRCFNKRNLYLGNLRVSPILSTTNAFLRAVSKCPFVFYLTVAVWNHSGCRCELLLFRWRKSRHRRFSIEFHYLHARCHVMCYGLRQRNELSHGKLHWSGKKMRTLWGANGRCLKQPGRHWIFKRMLLDQKGKNICFAPVLSLSKSQNQY